MRLRHLLFLFLFIIIAVFFYLLFRRPSGLVEKRERPVPESISRPPSLTEESFPRLPSPAKSESVVRIQIPEERAPVLESIPRGKLEGPEKPPVSETICEAGTKSLSRIPWKLWKEEGIKEKVNYDLGLVFFERYRDSVYLGTEKVLSFSRYLSDKISEGVYTGLREERERERLVSRGQTGISGLIPEIEIPRVPLIGESRINISGDNRITLGGRSTVLSGGVQTGRKGSLFPELKMEQVLNLNLSGTIGERTKVLIDHSSQRELEAKNRVKLEYTGGEDDIVQKVEIGETQLSIPQTAFTGDIPTRKGLFGISANGAIGGANLYLIASREQSQPQTKEFKGRASLYSDTLYDYEFVKGRFFLLAESLISVKELYLYYDDNQPYGTGKIPAIATINPASPEDTLPNPQFKNDYRKGRFVLLEGNKDYRLHTTQEGKVFVELLQDVTNGWLAVSYITANDETIGGNKFQDSLLVLKLVKAYRYTPDSRTWGLTLRNIYQLKETKVKLQEVKIFRDEPDIDLEAEPTTGKTFLEITGLDPDGDGIVTYPQFLPTLGLLIFPYSQPFALPSLSVRDTVIYTSDLLRPGEGGRYYILIKYTTLTQVISLGPDVEEGSERVYVSGVEQKRGEDYRIDYTKGEVTFLKPLPPDADIKITYEYLPLFSAVSRSILGLRSESKILANGKIGTSFYLRSEMTPDERPNLGSEPYNRVIWEGDFSYQYRNQDFTSFLDQLPLIRAREPTEVNFSGEIALSFPNPNLFGVSYIDDFEGIDLSERIDLNAVNWFFSSVPVGCDTANFARSPLLWFNPPRRIRKDSIFGPRVKEDKEEMVDILRVIFSPTNENSWSGFSTPIRGGVDIRNLDYIQGIFRTRNRMGKIVIDVATALEEDIPRRTQDGRIVGYNNSFDTEDRNRNGILDVLSGEDSGLDTVPGKDGEEIPGDDGNDDYDPNTNPQGTEGNRRLDSEDIDGNGFSPRGDNHYYQYEIPLSDTTYFTTLFGNWRIFRIPLKEWTRKIGTPSDQEIRVIRVWFVGFPNPETIDFYQLELAGNKWRGGKVEGSERTREPYNEGPGGDTTGPSIIPDTSEIVKIYQVSIENDTSYTSPFELKRDAFGRKEKEASLAISFQNLRAFGKIIVPQLFSTKEDWRNYKKLRIYLHQDRNVNPLFFIRIGPDSNNYYQFRSFIDRGRKLTAGDGLWYEFEISLDTFIALKTLTLSNSEYSFQGNPNFAEVRFIALGIENPYPYRISGSVWFDDIRLISPYSEKGLGYQSSVRFSLSDLANFSLSLSYLEPNFIRLSEGGGVKTGNYATNRAYSLSLNLDRFLPSSWQLSLPFNYSATYSTLMPKFHPLYPDKRIPRNSPASESAKGKSFSESFGTSIRKGKSNNKLLNYTLEALSFLFTRGRSYKQEMLSTDTSLRTSSGISYGINPNLSFELGKTEISYFPQNISFSLSYSSSRTKRQSLIPRIDARTDTIRDSTRTKTAFLSFNSSYSPIENLTIDYGSNYSRDLFGITPEGKTSRFGVETDREKNFGISYSLELWDILNPNFDYNGGYSESRLRQRDTVLGRRRFDNEGEFRIETDLNFEELGKKLVREKDTRFFSKLLSFLEKTEPLDISYTLSRNSEFPLSYSSPPILYQLGFIDQFKERETLKTPLSRDQENRFSLSSRFNLKDLGIGYSYENEIEKNFTGGVRQGSYSVTWPSLNITLSNLERFLKKYVRSANLSIGYQRTRRKSGQLLPSGQLSDWGLREEKQNNFSPLIGFQATWQKRIQTNFNLNYSISQEETKNIGLQETRERGFDFSASYSFSAPQGIKIPFLPRIRLTQEITLSWNIRYSRGERTRIERGVRTPTGSDENISSRLSTSYRVSNALDAGGNIGYTSYHNILTRIHSQSVELNFWVLFRF
uniref:Gliding motility protein SprA N-terminal domain-containing protein n=1 Tax=candidate division WOR-3 bacterium TaxID=2052148 RepID=A0A7C3Z216_UNCW3